MLREIEGKDLYRADDLYLYRFNDVTVTWQRCRKKAALGVILKDFLQFDRNAPGFTYSPEAARMLLDLLAYLTGTDETAAAACESPLAEAAWFPKARKLVVLNNGETALRTAVAWPDGSMDVALEPMETRIMEV